MKNNKSEKHLISLLLCVILLVFMLRMTNFESGKRVNANAAQSTSEIVIDEKTKRVLSAPVVKTLKPALKVTTKTERGQSFSFAVKLAAAVNLFSVILKLSEGLWKKAIK